MKDDENNFTVFLCLSIFLCLLTGLLSAWLLLSRGISSISEVNNIGQKVTKMTFDIQ